MNSTLWQRPVGSTDFKTQILDLRPGAHLCLVYEKDPAEQLPALIPFIQQGLSADEQFIYIVDDHTVEQLAQRLEESGIDVPEETARGRLKLLTRREWRQPGELNSNSKALQVGQFIAAAKASGFSGIRFAVEMTWTLEPDISAEQLEHWEATINTLFDPAFPTRLICQYNRTRLSPETILAGLHTHPLAILGEQFCSNVFYQAPLLLNRNGHIAASSKVDWMISQLTRARHAQLEKAQREAAERLKVEQALRLSEERFRLAAHTEALTLYEQDTELRYVWLYPSHPEHAGSLGRTDLEILPNAQGEALTKLKREVMESGVALRREVQAQLADGVHFYDLFVSPRRNSRGDLIGVSGVALDITQSKRTAQQQHALYELVAAVNRAGALPEIYDAALDAICRCHNAERASILLYDDAKVMRFKAWRGLSPEYRLAVEGHSPWTPDDPDPQVVWINNLAEANLEPQLRAVVAAEGIQALAFIPITSERQLLGKFMIYYNTPHEFTTDEIRPAETIASQIAFALQRQKNGQALEQLIAERTASLREAIAQMEEFSYSVSHDLRAPVRAMQGYAKAVLEDCGDKLDAQSQEYLERIVRNGTRMDRLIQDILTYSRLSRREIQLQPVSLARLVREIIQQYPEMQPPHAQIEFAEPLDDVLGHEPSLSQAISNLLSNAVKFVPPGATPKVRIGTQRRDAQVRFFVHDRGIGIRSEYQHRLFGLFERIHPEHKYEGTGIGLAIVRKAVERMGGKVGVESDGLNGSRFWLELPAVNDDR